MRFQLGLNFQLGLACSEEAFAAHNDEVDSEAEVLALIAAAGGFTGASSCSYNWLTSVDVPAWDSGACFVSGQGRDVSTFNCAAAAQPWKQRLCYCSVPPGLSVQLVAVHTCMLGSTCPATCSCTCGSHCCCSYHIQRYILSVGHELSSECWESEWMLFAGPCQPWGQGKCDDMEGMEAP